MVWKKYDFNFNINQLTDTYYSHATVPTPIVLDRNRLRVLFSSRDKENRNRIYRVDLNISDKVEIVEQPYTPVLDLGLPGYFDCDGLYGTSIVKNGDELFLYYAGWNAGLNGYFYSNIGVAVSRDNGLTFERKSNAPILSRDEIDPWACMAPFVSRIAKDEWRMWYTSGVKLWSETSGGIKSLYDIKTATSRDGIIWLKTGKTAIALGDETTNIARPCVIQSAGGFEVWYPYVNSKNDGYLIGYGVSDDGYHFQRLDDAQEAMLRPDSKIEWHSKEVTYPHVFIMNGRKLMLFNGNGFGKTGFGLAEWQSKT